jgi:hypothetical protein
MFEVVFSKDVDVTPQEAKAMRMMGTAVGASGGVEIGVEPCAYITVGFIWPCGTLHVGGCATIGKEKAAALGVSTAAPLKLDPKKDTDKIQKMLAVPNIKATKPDHSAHTTHSAQP